MSKTISAGLAAHYAKRSHSRCRLALLVLRDGSSIGVTDHDQPINFDLIGEGEIEYKANTGATFSDIVLQIGLDADNCEIRIPLKGTGDFTLERVAGGRLNRARTYLAEINWKTPADGALKQLAGNVSEVRIEGGEAVLEIRSDCDRYNQVIGRLITNNCDADFGDGVRCHATPVEIVGTVDAVADAMNFAVTFAGSYAADFFNGGTVEALTGDLAGTDPVEIFDWTAGGTITLFMPLVEAPAIGDTFTIKQGCPKNRAACMAFGQILNFRGFPETPGSDQIFRPTIPGQGND